VRNEAFVLFPSTSAAESNREQMRSKQRINRTQHGLVNLEVALHDAADAAAAARSLAARALAARTPAT
jgi:hypothetical protein